jgi:phospholipid/cholesterol/gamma-HCH transport system ATP-binding protein|nr:MAG: organic solvent resistance ABC transporter ATP-binding protein [Acidobacteriota bacterium]
MPIPGRRAAADATAGARPAVRAYDIGMLEPASDTSTGTVPRNGLPAIAFDRVSFAFDDLVLLDDISFTVPRGAMRFLLGASGAGKSILLKLILGLMRPDSGTITVNGQRIDNLPEDELLRIRTDIGMVFQEIALFDSLSVEQNVGYRLFEEMRMPREHVRRRVEEVLGFIGLADYIDRMPSELSGGQRRRVALARAMASKPSLLLFDDPTTGLDPITSITVNDEVVKLRDLEGVTAVFATHQLRDAFYIATHEAVREADGTIRIVPADDKATSAEFMVLHEGRFIFEGNADELLASTDPYLKEFLYKTLPPW